METNRPLNYLFVYGTLRKEFGLKLSNELQDEMIYVGDASINGELYDIGDYPAALPTQNSNSIISGEIYQLKHPRKTLKILDEYEGYDRRHLSHSEYYRKKEVFQIGDGKEVQAWVYWYNFPIKNKRRIRQKDYLQYLKNKTA